jgi:hypothetical protein
MADEKVVRATWERLNVADWWRGMNCTMQAWSIHLPDRWTSRVGSTADDAEMWEHARLHTEEVLRKVAEIDAAIAWVRADIDEQTQDCGVDGCGCNEPARFILALLQRERESTARGLRKDGK